jgi:siroheme synthase (precorrin-2 oxidase/ferrochelatase)
VKIAISTNGKSPTTAKIARVFEEIISDIRKWF